MVFVCVDIYYTPVYIWPHSKAVLMQAILADTQFLANNSIMDYSLLAALDEENGELVVGIIGEIKFIITMVIIIHSGGTGIRMSKVCRLYALSILVPR